MSAPALGTPAFGPDAAPWRLAHFTRATVAKLVVAACRMRFVGEDNLPASGGYILACNHVSLLDPVVLWAGSPRPIHIIAKQELFDMPVMGWVAPRFWALPVRRGTADREAIRRASALLTHGELVGIFPEGTRKREGVPGSEPGDARAGVALIAVHAGVPVVPVGIYGTQHVARTGLRLPRFRRVTFSYGAPVYPDDFSGLGRRERLDAMTAEIMRSIAEQRALAEKE
jgi:1-acyl-sn-glycerol-3-phosphate acyltransferase